MKLAGPLFLLLGALRAAGKQPTKTSQAAGLAQQIGQPALKAYALPVNKSACKECCPRPKATVTVTETGYSTVTCTHTISSDRTQTTTVRFTNTVRSVRTQTSRVNFTNTSTIVSSRQITTFRTTNTVQFRVFTSTITVLTSFTIVTMQSTVLVPTTRTSSTLVFTTTTTTLFTTFTEEVVSTQTLTSSLFASVVVLEVTTVDTLLTVTATDTQLSFGIATLPETTWSSIRTSSATYFSFTTILVLVGTAFSFLPTPTFFDGTEASLTSTNILVATTATVADFTIETTTLTFSYLTPIQVI